MYSDDLTFTLVNSRSIMVRRVKVMNRYKHRFVLKTVKHSVSVMMWPVLVARGEGRPLFPAKKLHHEWGEIQAGPCRPSPPHYEDPQDGLH